MFADSPAIQSRDDELLLSDGIRLISKLWFPEAGGPWPALLMRQPYGRHIASTVTYAHPSWWAQHGFLVVVQDVRGQGDSTGVFSGFSQEAHDTAATHEWGEGSTRMQRKAGLLRLLLSRPHTTSRSSQYPATGLLRTSDGRTR